MSAEILVPLFRDYFRSPRAMRVRHRAAKSAAAKGEARHRALIDPERSRRYWLAIASVGGT